MFLLGRTFPRHHKPIGDLVCALPSLPFLVANLFSNPPDGECRRTKTVKDSMSESGPFLLV